MRIIFLDVDGVLRVGAKTCSECVFELNRVTTKTGAGIVVTSTWRRDVEIYGTLRMWGVYGKFIGKTPDLSTRGNEIIFGVERWREIEKFLDDYAAEIRDIVIFDDDDDMGKYIDRLVQTDPHRGLTKKDADRAIRMFLR